MRRGTRRGIVGALAVLAVLIAGCSGSDSGTDEVGGSATTSTSTPAAASSASTDPLDLVPPTPLGGDPAEACPDGYVDTPPTQGENVDFAAADQQRAFHLLLPDAEGPRPLFVALTGTVQPEVAFLEQSQLDLLTEDGWIVMAPVRNDNGTLWPPWDAMRTPDDLDRPNPDVELIVDAIHCIAAHTPVDANRIYVGGISIGGTLTNYVLQRESALFAGGIVGSGHIITTRPAEPEPLDDMIVIVAWGGDGDVWGGCSDGQMGDDVDGDDCVAGVRFVEDASLASQYYDAEPEVVQVACTMDLGHIWLTPGTARMAAILLSHPKGLPGEAALPAEPAAPEGFTCSLDPYVHPDADLDLIS